MQFSARVNALCDQGGSGLGLADALLLVYLAHVNRRGERGGGCFQLVLRGLEFTLQQSDVFLDIREKLGARGVLTETLLFHILASLDRAFALIRGLLKLRSRGIERRLKRIYIPLAVAYESFGLGVRAEALRLGRLFAL